MMNLELSEISKYKYYPDLISNFIYRNCFKSELSVDYLQYKKFSVDCDELDEYLFSLLLFNKKIILNTKKFYISKYDLFNRISNNQNFLSNYITEYNSREKLTSQQINNINESLLKIIENNLSKIIDDKEEFEAKRKEEIAMIKERKINEKKTEIENIGKKENINIEEIDFLKYDILLEIKKLEDEIDQHQFIIDILNYHYSQLKYSSTANYIIDVCFGLRNLFHYIYDFNLDQHIPLIYISKNLPLLKCDKDKLLSLFEENSDLNLSHLFSVYEYFESLIFIEFIYHINKGYFEPLPLYLSKKIIYIFEKDEIKKNIIFSKLEFIEAIRKCLCRYIACSNIEDNYITEDLNSDLFELLLKEDLWEKNIEKSKLKESFNYIYKNLKFKLQVKHIFNLFEILIEIDNKKYFSFDEFKGEEKKENKKEDKEERLEIFEKNEEKEKKEEKIEPKEPEEKKEKEIDENKDPFFLEDKQYNFIYNRKKYIHKLINKSKLISKYLEVINIKDKNKDKSNMDLTSYKNLITEVINYGSIFYNENLISKLYEFINKPDINIKFSSLKQRVDLLHINKDIEEISLFNENKIIILFDNGGFELYSFDKKTFREKTIFTKLEIENLDNINNINKTNCMKELLDGSLLFGTKNGHILKMKLNERQKKDKVTYILQLLNDIKLENKERIEKFIILNDNMFISKDENNIKIWNDNKIIKDLNRGEIFKVNNYLLIIEDGYPIFYDIKNDFNKISKMETKICNYTIIDEKIMVAEDSSEYTVHLIDMEERKDIKEKKYNPHSSFILKKIYNKWYFRLSKNDKDKLIKVNIINNNGNYDIMADNNEFIIVDSSKFLMNLFDEFFIICKDGNISCYGYFL